MTTKLKRTLIVFLCTALFAGVMFGNAQSENSEAAESTVTLKWLTAGPGIQRDFDKVMAEANSRLPELVPNTQFELEVIHPRDYRQKFDLMMAAGEQLDIAWKGWMQPLAEEVRKGSYMPLDELINTHSPDIKKEIPTWVLNPGRIGGELFIIPKYEMHYWQLGLYSPKEEFEAYFDVENWKKVREANTPYATLTPEVYDAMEDYLAKLKAAGKLGSGFSPWVLTSARGHDLIEGPPNWTYTMPAIARVYNPGVEWDFTVQNTFKTQETITFFEKMADWREKGYLREDLLSLTNPREFEKANEGGYAVWFHNYVNPLRTDYAIKDQWEREHVIISLDQYPLVQAKANDGQVIPRTAAYPEQAIKVIELMTTAKGSEFYNLLVWGLEGEHYKTINEKRIETLNYAGQGNIESPYGLWKWAMGNVWNAKLTQTDDSDDLWDYFDEMHEMGVKSPYAAFKFDPSNVVNEVAQVRTVLSEYVKSFMCGHYDEATYDEFLEKLDKAGTDKVIVEVQSQLDKYLEEQGIPKNGYKM